MERILERLKKLFALANDKRGNEHEAEVAWNVAEALMRQHHIDRAAVDRTLDQPTYQWSEEFVAAGFPIPVSSYVSWFGTLSLNVARFTDCRVSRARMPEGGAGVRFQGDAVDTLYAKWLCESLRDQCRTLSALFVGSREERKSYRYGFVNMVGIKMRNLKNEREWVLRRADEAQGNGHALVAVEKKLAMRDAKFGPQRVCTIGGQGRNAYGWNAGDDAGSRANLNRPLGSTPRKMLTS